VPKKNESFSPYFGGADADQVRAAVQEAGHLEGYASITDLVEAATLREVKRLQNRYNGGKKWPGVPAGGLRPGRSHDTGGRTGQTEQVRIGGLLAHADVLIEAMLDVRAFGPVSPHSLYLRARYAELLPVVMSDVLRCIETGGRLSPHTLAALRVSARTMRLADVPLRLMLRGGTPALRVLYAYARSWKHALSHQELTLLMERAARLSAEMTAYWVEFWFDAIKNPHLGGPRADGDSLDDILEPVPGILESPGLDMLALVAAGHSNEQIAEALDYSPQAVKWHLARLMRAWKVGNRAALVSVAFLRGALCAKRAHLSPDSTSDWKE
jgi:DNA-binding CsgD family transcriptional regulator